MQSALPFVVVALLCATVLTMFRLRSIAGLRADALVYVADMKNEELKTVPSPQEMLDALHDARDRLALRAKFLAVRIRNVKESEFAGPLEGAGEALAAFIAEVDEGVWFYSAATVMYEVVTCAAKASMDDALPSAVRRELLRWMLDARRWMTVVDHVYRREIEFSS